MKQFMKRAGLAVCVAGLLGACETYDQDYHHGHRHAYYRSYGGSEDGTYYGYERTPVYRYDTRGNYSGDWPYRTERAYVRPGGVRVYRY